MRSQTKRNYLIPEALAFMGLPLLLWAMGNVPRRTMLKETFSLLFILAFSQMLGQFYLSRGGRNLFSGPTMGSTIKIHKIVGYTVTTMLLVHPVLIVVPRYFESGITPLDAFVTIVTTFDSRGVVLGIIAWSLMITLGITSLIRNRLPMTYKTWRLVHGILSALFISVAAWHAIDLGRHTDRAMSIYMMVLAAGGLLLLTRSIINGNKLKTGDR